MPREVEKSLCDPVFYYLARFRESESHVWQTRVRRRDWASEQFRTGVQYKYTRTRVCIQGTSACTRCIVLFGIVCRSALHRSASFTVSDTSALTISLQVRLVRYCQ